ncbi:MAG: multicopper oxidase domain-containing protein [Streptomycetaceae bacterium]|nr:multicopper oxidase domain-containing protein [Streptomycetaceae bacterium]
MERLDRVRMTRRDMLRLSIGGAGMFALTASGLAVSSGLGSEESSGSIFIEAFPTSPLILSPFNDPLPIPKAAAPVAKSVVDTWKSPPGPDNQDFVKTGPAWKHQLWPGTAPVADYPQPIVYQVKLEVAGHDFTSSLVQPIDSNGRDVSPPGTGDPRPRNLPTSTIYGFDGTFPGPMINFEYHKPALVRFENHLDVDNGFDRQDFGAPNYAFVTHLHNGHTASESDGNPAQCWRRFSPMGRVEHEAAYEPGEWVDNMYLGYPAGGDEREIQSFFWFHDHVHGHTSDDVYKGMVGLMPLYDPKIDRGDETDPNGLRLPGVRTDNPDGSFDVEYDIPLVFYDAALDDGVTPHKDFHTGNGETHPEWWGKTYFRHLPNHGFVGDIFTVNGTAFPVLEVKRRKYRLRFLDASISRIYQFELMHSSRGPKAARDLGYNGDELQGQYRLPDAEQCMRFVQIAGDGGLLPRPIVRDSFELWPAKRREVIVDFTKYMDGTPTQKGDEIYLVNTMKMTTGRMWDSADPDYRIPMVKILIGEDAPDNSIIPARLRDMPDIVPGAYELADDKTIPTFELQRGSSVGSPEFEWLINGKSFDPANPQIAVKKDSGGVWRIRNGGGGWVHPLHIHMEEHHVVARNGRSAPDARHPDDTGKEDVVALDPSEDVVIARRFRTFVGPYVAHCHNLTHEDHAMMFAWEILP